jgi:ABC-2 type transport system ATP-binding protein
VSSPTPGTLLVRGATAKRIGAVARDNQIAVSELVAETVSLEEAYMKLTDNAVEYRATSARDSTRRLAA